MLRWTKPVLLTPLEPLQPGDEAEEEVVLLAAKKVLKLTMDSAIFVEEELFVPDETMEQARESVVEAEEELSTTMLKTKEHCFQEMPKDAMQSSVTKS